MKTLEKIPANTASTAEDTIFTINFDFTDAAQKAILDELQANNYSLFAFKGAKGTGQVTAGVPVWFTQTFQNVFGTVAIDYEPRYQVYAYNKEAIGAFTTIQMSSHSAEVGLGTALIFQQDGTFVIDTKNTAPDGIITVTNNSPAGTPALTFGLAAMVNGSFAPFCAFTCTPQGSVSMEPVETVCLFAGETGLQSGSVVGATASPGCSFDFDASAINYNLEFVDGSFALESAPASLPVTPTPSGSSLTQLLNS